MYFVHRINKVKSSLWKDQWHIWSWVSSNCVQIAMKQANKKNSFWKEKFALVNSFWPHSVLGSKKLFINVEADDRRLDDILHFMSCQNFQIQNLIWSPTVKSDLQKEAEIQLVLTYIPPLKMSQRNLSLFVTCNL